MDKQREKLIGLLSGVPFDVSGNRGVGAVADHLLANGVIVPPCKVGDKAYFIIEDETAGEKYISAEPITEVGSKGFWTSASYIPGDDMTNFELWETIGKTAFLSKEDAEKALRKEDEGK